MNRGVRPQAFDVMLGANWVWGLSALVEEGKMA
jgi:hypothetical protein